ALATDRDGVITNVQFWANDTLVGSVTTGISNVYSFTWSDMNVDFGDERTTLQDLDGEWFSDRTGGSRNVSLTLPGGQSITFQFSFAPFGMFEEQATWTPPTGVQATLVPFGVSPLFNLLTGYWEASPQTAPDAFDFPEFVLTTANGETFYIYRQDLGEHW